MSGRGQRTFYDSFLMIFFPFLLGRWLSNQSCAACEDTAFCLSFLLCLNSFLFLQESFDFFDSLFFWGFSSFLFFLQRLEKNPYKNNQFLFNPYLKESCQPTNHPEHWRYDGHQNTAPVQAKWLTWPLLAIFTVSQQSLTYLRIILSVLSYFFWLLCWLCAFLTSLKLFNTSKCACSATSLCDHFNSPQFLGRSLALFTVRLSNGLIHLFDKFT